MTGSPDRPTVLDTSVLSNFAHVNRVELLDDLPRLATVEAVRTELAAGIETHSYLERAVVTLDDDIPVITPSPAAQEVEQHLLKRLDPGEAQALAVADVRNGTIVTDDGDARSIARNRDVPLTGSIGVLVRFVEDDVMSVEDADRYLKRWIDEAGFRAPARDIETFLDG
ncbi:PIN domain-containing protein [Halorhabdus rudnickae]|uniref:PIN domain-containing protein n=1 Tax=Halorhabdus rudnickae TaxID=1775544 RepID=UPI001082F18E|nr:PIN domain-containing protein [Halorhabdus rudnickae]